MEHTPSPFRQAAQRTEAERRTTADKFKTAYDDRKTPMGKTDKPNNSLPLIPNEQPKPAEPHHPVFGTKLETTVTEVPVKLSDVLDGLSTEEFDASKSKSPDEQDSPKAEPQSDDVAPEPVKTGEPPHWTENEGQKAIFDKFVGGVLDDFDLVDLNSPNSYRAVMLFMVNHGIEPKQYPSLGEAKNAFYAAALKEFKDDLKAIIKEKEYPLTTNTLPDILKHETVDDALHPSKGNMTGKGVRNAIASHVTSWWNERNLAINNERIQQRMQAEQGTTPTLLPGDPFAPATDDGVYLKLAIAGPSGSGKSYTSLQLATEMFPNGKIAFLCTEHGAAKRYAKHFKFNLMEIGDYHPQRFIDAIHAAEKYGYDVLIIDSFSHEWNGKNGILNIADGKVGGWKDATPWHQSVIEAIQVAHIHIIATMRSKMKIEIELDQRGKNIVRKLGMEPIQRDQTEYEFDVFAEIDMTNELVIAKSRCLELKADTKFPRGDGLAPMLKQWIAA